MNILRATASRLLRSAPLTKSIPSVRGAIHLDKDWGPGNYPKTEEERLAAAKKYNLLPEEYEAYDPDKWEVAFGDYPKRPILHRADEDSDQAWDYLMHHHNYGDPWHVNYVRYQWMFQELNMGDDYIRPMELFWFYFWSGSLVLFLLWFFDRYDRVTVFKPMHQVYPGVVHYHYPNSKIEMYEKHRHHH